MPMYSFYTAIRDFQISVTIVSTEMAQICIPIHYEMIKHSIHSSIHLYCVQVPRVFIYTQARAYAHIVCVTIRLTSQQRL